MYQILNKIKENKVVAVVRGQNEQEALNIILASIEGGIKSIEVTFTNPDAQRVIETLKLKYPSILVGAGTVIDLETARKAILAGASFIVSPNFDLDILHYCKEQNVPYLPGCMTVNEILYAMKKGVEIIKLFPGNVIGKEFVKAIKEPLPHIQVMVTGGVDQSNINEWFEAGCVAVGLAGSITKDTNNDFTKILTNVKGILQEVK
ncbi:bifunctional 2-keto-4-hydroxyglutarate aldolase/2-keto-3-deoxy-6-phosphogluconate aldolase [Priestia megaterium]|uniref:bifunctional 2-keto-4-hydroxyglutarate aldolase/2-keto-3-deoxy-6-phosphogluconate aldolase n=1 Tax=Priestia megaterium TaxID=1404 RepID=UPI000BF33AF8|nr:bifunctional 2-keto-4-hydroxyglutarate aldolase/2-keto-3-deoxy-6-phosphogluconate aldolase [Priestia megaterium]NGY70117.1 bifunctional 4-hydroxy-2-oxoglutarate aldolase/2-dehydro-3-deoxy-phosphogluconate aldolase [Priestia megaterium]PFT49522.1 bifunctional 2-keto-4-hydroxyglutarate aldolase/2-keto-3-deoxy-6-phosphogluconate aldolase [Priestia megaterium]